MRNITKSKLILVILVCTRLLGICQDGPTQVFKDYLIKYEKISFQFEDSIYLFTAFMEPNGYFYFREGFVESPHPGEYSIRRLDRKSRTFDYKDTFIKKSDSILKLTSLFPLLIKNDSSIINHYPHEYHPGISYELEYSYILSHLKEPKIFDNNTLRSVRVILPTEEFGIPHKYISVRLDFGEKNELIYSKGKFDIDSNLSLVQKDSCIVSQKDILKLEKLLQEINFKGKNYFIEVGLDIYPKYLLEYNTKSEYYVLARQFLSRDKRDQDLKNFVYKLLSVLNRNLKINNWL